MSRSFFKFPSTPHLAIPGGTDVRNDKILSEQERGEFLQHTLMVEEKMDGANLGISFSGDGDLILQNRGTILLAPHGGQWHKLAEWIPSKMDALFDVLADRFILFGEWCYALHSVHYTRLPDWFLGFDVYDQESEKFLSVLRRNEIFRTLGIFGMPSYGTGKYSIQKLQDFFAISHYSDHLAEGVYLRFDDENWLIQRAKLVNPAFTQALGADHWSRHSIRPNQLGLMA